MTNQVSSGNSRERKGIKKYPFPIQINSTNQSPRNCIPKKGICLSLKRYIYLHIFLPYLSYISIHIICIRPLSVDVHEGYDVFAPLHTNLIYVSNLIQNFLLLPLLLICSSTVQVRLSQIRSGQLRFSSAFSIQLLFQPRSAIRMRNKGLCTKSIRAI